MIKYEKIVVFFIGMALSVVLSIPVFAGQWINQSGTWFYLPDNNAYLMYDKLVVQ